MIIPWQEVNEDTLIAIVESFILREGTDYGEHETSFDDKKSTLLQQLKKEELVIVYSELHESINIMKRDNFEQ